MFQLKARIVVFVSCKVFLQPHVASFHFYHDGVVLLFIVEPKIFEFLKKKSSFKWYAETMSTLNKILTFKYFF